MRANRNIRSLFPLKDKNKYKSCVIYKEGCFCASRYNVKPNVMQKLDGMNIIIELKVQSHQNTFETTSTTVTVDCNHMDCHFKYSKKC